MYKAIVFEGGGPKGLFYYGCLNALKKSGILDKIECYAGSSIGAYTATVLLLGYTMDEIKEILLKRDFTKLVDDNRGFIIDSYHLISKYGYCEGITLNNWIKETINRKYPNKADTLTFEELYQMTGKKLIITGSNISQLKICYFSHETTPKMTISLALRISMGFPLIFTPVVYLNDYWADGGLIDNFPLKAVRKEYPAEQILGVKLLTSDETSSSDQTLNRSIKITNLFSYTHGLLKALLFARENADLYPDFWKHNIPLKVGELSILDTHFTEEEKLKIFEKSEQQTEDYLKNILHISY